MLNQAEQLIGRRRYRDAARLLDQVLRHDSVSVPALTLRGICSAELGDLKQARGFFTRLLEISPDESALLNLGNIAQLEHDWENAVEFFNRAVAINPNMPAALNNRGLAKLELNLLMDSLNDFDRALQLYPRYPEALNNRGTARLKLGDLPGSIKDFSSALKLRPDYVKSLVNRAAAHLEVSDYGLAQTDLAEAYRLNPTYDSLAGLLLHNSMRLCEWDGLSSLIESIKENLRNDRPVSTGFALISAVDSPSVQLTANRLWIAAHHPGETESLFARDKMPRDKIRIGYYSSDFHNHATAHLAVGLFEKHNRRKFEISAFSFGRDDSSAMRKRLTSAFDNFIDVSHLSDAGIAKLSKQQQIDIAVDLKGYTQGCRPGIFSRRCAPIQVNYLGYPGTTGAETMDYLIADQYIIPKSDFDFYSEKIVQLPYCYQVNDESRELPQNDGSRSGLNLPEKTFVFACFNNLFKIQPEVFNAWMAILQRCSNSVLWLLADNNVAEKNLRRQASSLGISPDRLIFASRTTHSAHLARHNAADVFLDCWPCSAHTTASDAVWMGLPLITLYGQSFASRVAASILINHGFANCVTNSPLEYEELAVRLYNNAGELRSLKAELSASRRSSPIFNTKLFCQGIEAAFEQMLSRQLAGLPPDHFRIDESNCTTAPR